MTQGNPRASEVFPSCLNAEREEHMDGIIYLVGLVVIVLAILSFLGLH